ncbi:hypothetical protein VPH35_096572 [Triticum aestivum]
MRMMPSSGWARRGCEGGGCRSCSCLALSSLASSSSSTLAARRERKEGHDGCQHEEGRGRADAQAAPGAGQGFGAAPGFRRGGRASELFVPPRDTRNNLRMQFGATLMESKFGCLQFYYLV